VLPSAFRMARSAEFAALVRSGARARRGHLVLHCGVLAGDAAPPRVGFVVGRTVGGSVVRHRVIRRLRALTAARLDALAPGSGLVVRALPGAAGASSAELGSDLDAALLRLHRRPGPGTHR
jgi:ribonuclease P protein component